MTEKLTARLVEMRAALGHRIMPMKLAAHSGGDYDSGTGTFNLSLFSRPITATFPDFVFVNALTSETLSDTLQALLLYYLNTADGTPLTDRWVSFADLPDGRFYNQAFQGYTGNELASYFKDDLTAFEHAAIKLDGIKLAYGDAAFSFHWLPRLMLAVVYYLGDEDFPASCKILFDASVSHYLPTDVCAIIGSMLTRKLLEAKV